MTQEAANRRRRPAKKKSPYLPYIIGGCGILVVIAMVLAIVFWPKTEDSKSKLEDQLFSWDRVPVKQGELWGFAGLDGNIAIKPSYQAVMPFGENGLAAAMKEGKWGYIDQNGTEKIPFSYSDTTGFSEGLAAICIGGRWGFINESGMNVVAAKYEYVGNFSSNKLALIKQNGLYGYVNTEGKEIVPPKFDSAGAFGENGLAQVCFDQLYGYIKSDGSYAVAPSFSALGACSASGLIPAKSDSLWGYIDEKGAWVIPAEYEYAYSFSDQGIAKVMTSGKYTFISEEGKPITEETFSDAGDFTEGYARVVQNGKFGLLKTDGSYAIPLGDTQLIRPVSQGLLVFRDKKGAYGYMDLTGNIVVEAQFTQAGSFRKDGYATVMKEEKWGIIDKNGKFVLPAQFDDIG